MGELGEERATDFDEALARNRYRVFKEKTYDALVSLKQIFHYHFINAQAPHRVGAGEHRARARIPELAGAGPAHV